MTLVIVGVGRTLFRIITNSLAVFLGENILQDPGHAVVPCVALVGDAAQAVPWLYSLCDAVIAGEGIFTALK